MTPTMKTKRRVKFKPLRALNLLTISVFVFFPIFWIALSSFKDAQEVRTPSVIFDPQVTNFITLFQEPYDFGRLLLNSLLVCVGVVVITVPLAAAAAYSLSRFQIPLKRFLLVLVLGTQFLPPVVLVLPYFSLFRDLGLLDTLFGLTLVNLTRTIPFSIWLLYGFIDSLPREIEESAMIDGAGEFRILRHITGPLAAPGLVTAGIFSFILAWNEFLYALLLTSRDAKTSIVGLVGVVGERDVPWELMSAGGMLVMIPVLVLSWLIRRHFAQGMTTGAVK
jgi:multiple sugar transport system permease protein